MAAERETDRQKSPDYYDRVMTAAMDAGHILLENGAEIFRVEDTMIRIVESFGMKPEHDEFFVLSNGIFLTGEDLSVSRDLFAKVRHIPVKGTNIEKIVQVNQLSRELEAGGCTLEQLEERLDAIRHLPPKKEWAQILASGVGAAAFCLLFGGGPEDSLASMLAGVIYWIFLLHVAAPHLSRITGNLFGGILITLICIVCRRIGIGTDLNHMIIGSIIPMIPGVSFTNGIRDIAEGDYISGAVRLLDASLVFMCIAIGVGFALQLFGGII